MKMKELLKVHSANRRQVRKAITQLDRALNDALMRENSELARVHVRCLFILWVSWLESHMNVLLHSANKIRYDERRAIVGAGTEAQRWASMIDILFRKHYLNGKQGALSKVAIGATPYYRYTDLSSILTDDIEPFIEIRNRLAHGQWHAALNNEGTAKNPDITRKLWTLTKQDIFVAKAIIQNFAWIITDCACSRSRFEGRYDQLVNRIDNSRIESQQRFNWLVRALKQRRSTKESLGYY